jgi:hypothetical protein
MLIWPLARKLQTWANLRCAVTQQQCRRLHLFAIKRIWNRHDTGVSPTVCARILARADCCSQRLVRHGTAFVGQHDQTKTFKFQSCYRRGSMKATQCGQLAGWRPVTLLAAVLLVSTAVLLLLPAAAADDASTAAAPVRVIVGLSEMPAAMVDNSNQRTAGTLRP